MTPELRKAVAILGHGVLSDTLSSRTEQLIDNFLSITFDRFAPI